MSDSKLLKIYLDTFNAGLYFISGGLIELYYKDNSDSILFDDYSSLLAFIRRASK